MEVIKAWLNSSRNYEEGVKLLLQYSHDTKLKRLFTIEGATDFKRKKLHDTLLQLLQQGTERIQAVEQQKETVIQLVSSAPGRWPGNKDEVVNALYLQWKPLFAEMNSLMARIYEVAKAGIKDEYQKHKAGEMAHRILDLDDACEAIYQKRDYYLKNGKLPLDKQPKHVVVDPIKIPLALKNAERYVRDFKAKLRKEPGNEKHAANLKKWEEMVIYYKKQLKLIPDENIHSLQAQ